MKLYFRNFRFAMLGVSVLCLALGLSILMWPEYAMKILCYGFGGVLVISGILQIASYVTGERVGLLRKLLLLSGIIGVVAGAWILLTPGMVLKLITIVLGVVLIYHGVMDVKYGIDIKGWNAKGWALAVVFGLCTCGVGVLVLVNPFEAEAVLIMASGIGFLFDGLTDMFTVFTLAHAKTAYDRLESAAPVIELSPASAETVAAEEEPPAEAQEVAAEGDEVSAGAVDMGDAAEASSDGGDFGGDGGEGGGDE